MQRVIQRGSTEVALLKLWAEFRNIVSQRNHTESAITVRVGDEVSVAAAKGEHCTKL
jgi:hypothetical protein